MDYTPHWKQLLSRSSDIQGGALLTVDGVHISSMSFGSPDNQADSIAHCTEIGGIARKLALDTNLGEFDIFVLEGEFGFLILMPILDKAFLAVLARKQAKLGVVMLDMRSAIDGAFGPGLATDPIFIPRPPRSDSAHAKPEWD